MKLLLKKICIAMKAAKTIEEKLSQLTPGMIDELEQYLDYLIKTQEIKAGLGRWIKGYKNDLHRITKNKNTL